MIEARDSKWQLARALGAIVLDQVLMWATILVAIFVIGSWLVLAG